MSTELDFKATGTWSVGGQTPPLEDSIRHAVELGFDVRFLSWPNGQVTVQVGIRKGQEFKAYGAATDGDLEGNAAVAVAAALSYDRRM